MVLCRIDTQGVIRRIVSLFSGHPELIRGFNVFLPVDHSIECPPNSSATGVAATIPASSAQAM